MSSRPLDIVVLGLSLSSSWGNGHATTFRALLKALAARGHRILFLERDQSWYASHRDLTDPAYCELALYDSVAELDRWRERIARADAVMVGSYVPDGIEVARRVRGFVREGAYLFYDIDTPVTLAAVDDARCAYLTPDVIRLFDVYLSFTGGPTLRRLETDYGARAARPFYCSVDPDAFAPQDLPKRWDLSYLGTYSPDRQPKLESLLLEVARRAPDLRFAVAGSGYPADLVWPANVEWIPHLAPPELPSFYAASRFTLNLTRADMTAAGYSPSVRLFEAAATGCPVVSDNWAGLDELFRPDQEIVIAEDADDVLRAVREWPAERVARLGSAARAKVLGGHTASHRAREFETYVDEALASSGAIRVGEEASSGLAVGA